MEDQRKVILGLSLGTQTLGMALVKNGVLEDWQVKNYTGVWSANKLRIIILSIERYAEANHVTAISFKMPESCRSSSGIKEIARAIKKYAEEKNIRVDAYTIEDFKMHYKVKNKKELMEYVVLHHPELKHTLSKAQKVKKVYYVKIFEAVFATMLS